MKRSILVILALYFIPIAAYTQTTAMDFNQQDCDGTQHHLFAELDAGSVVVISYVMMNCSSCIVATNELKTITSNFETSNPGRVKLYSMGYLNSYTCAQMNNWRSIGGFTHPVFTGGQAQTDYYGGMGMPTIVVLATNNHSVLFKKLGYSDDDKPGIIAAINEGLLYNPSSINEMNTSGVRIFPLQATDQITVKLNNPESGFISISDLTGREVQRSIFTQSISFTEDISSLQRGLYLVNVYSNSSKITTVKIIKY